MDNRRAQTRNIQSDLGGSHVNQPEAAEAQLRKGRLPIDPEKGGLCRKRQVQS